MTLPSSPNSISMSQIANEFGYTDSPRTKLGDYRTTNGQGNFPVSFGTLSFSSIDGGASVATGINQIAMSQFRGTRLQQVVNFHGSGKGGAGGRDPARVDAIHPPPPLAQGRMGGGVQG